MNDLNYITFQNALRDLQDLINNIETSESTNNNEIQNLIEIRDLCKYISKYLSEDITIKQRSTNTKNN